MKITLIPKVQERVYEQQKISFIGKRMDIKYETF